MQIPPPLQQVALQPAPPAAATSPPLGRARARSLSRGRPLMVVLSVLAVAAGVLLGGRAAAEDARTAARAALAAGDPARAVALDEAIAARAGAIMLLDPGARSAAGHEAQLARLSWARQLAGAGQVDAAIRVLALVNQPALRAQAAQTRADILVGAAAAATKAGRSELALLRLAQAAQRPLSAVLQATVSQMRAADEVQAAGGLVQDGRAPDAVAMLDDAAANGAATAAASVYPAALLAAAQVQMQALELPAAAGNLSRLVHDYPRSRQAATARQLLRAPQTVTGTLVDSAGHGVAGRVRLSTHFTQLSGGYITSGPFYYGSSDAAGDFSIAGVPVGGPYVLEYMRDSGWMTLVDPRSGEPANPVTVRPLIPQDLSFIVLPG